MRLKPQQLDKGLHDLDYHQLDRDLDWVKSRVFINNDAAFMGPLLCNLHFMWTTGIPTAATDGVRLWWNPYWFQELPKETRRTVLVHELWHPAGLDIIRRGDRLPRPWNWACDYRINDRLKKQGYTFQGWNALLDPRFPEHMPPEDIYDQLMLEMGSDWANQSGDDEDMFEADPETIQQMINNFVQSSHSARMAGQGSCIPGDAELYLKQFLNPKIAWEKVLYLFFNELGGEEDYTWSTPDRRFQDMYLPSIQEENDRLEHVCFLWDVSGSCTDEDVQRQTSEVKHIKDTFNPEKLTLIQFDTQITDVQVMTDEEPFHEIKIIGRGGTMWAPVKEYLEEHKPTIVVIFTDMGFWDAVTALNYKPEILWVVLNNPHAKIPFGRSVFI